MNIESLKETEIKILGVSYPLLVRKLKKAGAVKKGSVYLRDWYVDTKDRTMKKQGKTARLRSYGGEKFEITIKTKIASKNHKVRLEENIAVPSLEAGKLMLHMFGFECLWYKEKIRVTYMIDNTAFDVDFYDDMPPVLEIEGTKNEIKTWVRKLRLQDHQQVNRGAKKLFKHYGKTHQKMKVPMSQVAM